MTHSPHPPAESEPTPTAPLTPPTQWPAPPHHYGPSSTAGYGAEWGAAAAWPQPSAMPWRPVAQPTARPWRTTVVAAVAAAIFGLGGGLVGSAIFADDGGSGLRTSDTNGTSINESASEAAINARESVVAIATRDGSGSGVVVTSDGYILTNNHVVAGSRSVEVTLADGSTARGTVVETEASQDLALIKVDNADLKAAVFADSTGVIVGDAVYAIGSPFGLNGTVTRGIVSALDRTISTGEGRSSEQISGMLQTDAAINPGNSGGALVDSNGNVIGINTAIASTSNANAGIGFAIPSNTAKEFAEEAIASDRGA